MTDDDPSQLARVNRAKHRGASRWRRLHGGVVAWGALAGLSLVLIALAGNTINPDGVPWFSGLAAGLGAPLAGLISGYLTGDVREGAIHGGAAGFVVVGTLVASLTGYLLVGTPLDELFVPSIATLLGVVAIPLLLLWAPLAVGAGALGGQIGGMTWEE